MKTALAAIGAVVVAMALIAMITNRDKKAAAGNTDDKLAELPYIAKQSDDMDEIHSQFTDEYFRPHENNMLEVQFGLGQPNRIVKFAEHHCDLVALVAIYNDLDGKAFAMEYRNLHCQPDQRAYHLIGIHPLPGQWSRKVSLR
jgi:hypothetical protein